MSFTVKDIFELGKHRMNVGMGIRDSWIDLHKTPPKKVEEDGYMACSYDEGFRERAEAIISRYLAKLTPARKKRPRRNVAYVLNRQH